MAQWVKNLPMQEKQEMWVWSLGREDPLEEEMQPTLVFLSEKPPWTEEPGALQSKESQRVGYDWVCMRARACVRAHTHTHTHISYLSLVIKDAKIEKTEIKSFVIFPEFV